MIMKQETININLYDTFDEGEGIEGLQLLVTNDCQ